MATTRLSLAAIPTGAYDSDTVIASSAGGLTITAYNAVVAGNATISASVGRIRATTLIDDIGFDDASQWTTSGILSITTSQLRITGPANAQPKYAPNSVSGRTYRYRIDVGTYTGITTVSNITYGGQVLWDKVNGAGVHTGTITASSSTQLSVNATGFSGLWYTNSINVWEDTNASVSTSVVEDQAYTRLGLMGIPAPSYVETGDVQVGAGYQQLTLAGQSATVVATVPQQINANAASLTITGNPIEYGEGGAWFNGAWWKPPFFDRSDGNSAWWEQVTNNTYVNAQAVSFNLARNQTTVTADRLVDANPYGLNITVNNASVTTPQIVFINTGSASYTVTAYSATVTTDTVVSCTATGLTIAGQAATVDENVTFTANSASLSVAGQAATIPNAPRQIQAGYTPLTLVSNTAGISLGQTIDAEVAVFVFGGYGADVTLLSTTPSVVRTITPASDTRTVTPGSDIVRTVVA